jgi:hypothetical protein
MEISAMKAAEIRRAVDEGLTVCWMDRGYEVIRGDGRNEYFICCMNTSHCISLTHADGVTLNGAEDDFFIA